MKVNAGVISANISKTGTLCTKGQNIYIFKWHKGNLVLPEKKNLL